MVLMIHRSIIRLYANRQSSLDDQYGLYIYIVIVVVVGCQLDRFVWSNYRADTLFFYYSVHSIGFAWIATAVR